MSLEDVPDYLDVITKPMDFITIDAKIASHVYKNVQEFQVGLRSSLFADVIRSELTRW